MRSGRAQRADTCWCIWLSEYSPFVT